MKDFRVWMILLNPPLVAAFIAMGSSQVFKVMRPIFSGRAPDVSKLADYGGFPSGHTAFIIACVVGIGVDQGFDSGLFALGFVTAAILVYDIIKMRKTVDLTRKETERLLAHAGLREQERPPQFGAHSLSEIAAGGIWGVVCAAVVCWLWP